MIYGGYTYLGPNKGIFGKTEQLTSTPNERLFYEPRRILYIRYFNKTTP